MAEPRRVYFDSQPLVAGQWPSPSQKLVGVIKLASSLGILCFLPEAVRMELEASWLRDLTSDLSKMDTASENVAKSLRQVGERLPVSEPVNFEQVTEAYQAKVAHVLKELALLPVPTTSRDLVEVFKLALERNAPFHEKDDRGVQDCVILLSVVDHLRQNPESAVFVTVDEHLKKSNVGRLSEGTLLDLRFTSLEELQQELRGHLETKQQEAWRRDCELAEQAIKAAWSELDTFLAQSISLLPSDLGFFGTTVEGIRAAHARLLQDVTTPFDPDRATGTGVTISATVEVEFEVVGTRLFEPELPRPLKVGEELTIKAAFDRHLRDMTTAPQRVVTSTIRVFDVEAEAIFEGAAYSHVTFKSAKMKGDELTFFQFVRPWLGEAEHSLPGPFAKYVRDRQARKKKWPPL